MSLKIGNGCFRDSISNDKTEQIDRTDTSPHVSVWEKIKAFFCSTNKHEALELIRQIYHPPAGTTREDVAGRFERLRTLAYGGFEENVQSRRHGEKHFCILDEKSREMLSVTLDDAGNYTVKCPEYSKIHHLTLHTERGEEFRYNDNSAYPTLQAARTPDKTETPSFATVLSEWKRAAPPAEAADRACVVEMLRNIHNCKTDSLNLSGLNISSLPDHLPSCIKKIDISDVPLTSLPALPDGMTTLYVSNTQLTSLPALPKGITTLSVSDTPLTSLPVLPQGMTKLSVSDTPLTSLPALPKGVKVLYVSDTQLTSLPALPEGMTTLSVSKTSLTSLPALPQGVETLIVRDTPLTRLPALPEGLGWMNISGASLTELPELPGWLSTLYIDIPSLTRLPELPKSLRIMSVKNTSITSLPELPKSLRSMSVENTSITSLPESITGLSPDACVEISNNPLSERTCQTLRGMLSAPDYSGPTINFSMAGGSAPGENSPLYNSVVEWLTQAKEGEPSPADRWKAFELEDNAGAFRALLDMLSVTVNFQNDPGFKAQTASWLSQLAENVELRTKTFAMATQATSSCEDRVTLAMNHMKSVQLVHNAEKGGYDKDLSGLVSAGREMFRLEKLEKIARHKVSTLTPVVEIDKLGVYLAYQTKLKERLGLTTVATEMRYFGAYHVTESDLQAAELQVKTAEDGQFSEWILQWGPLRSVLERSYPEFWGRLVEKKGPDFDDSYRTLCDAELKPAGLVGDADAERAIGVRARERAEQAFLEGLRPLAHDVLGKYLKAQWS